MSSFKHKRQKRLTHHSNTKDALQTTIVQGTTTNLQSASESLKLKKFNFHYFIQISKTDNHRISPMPSSSSHHHASTTTSVHVVSPMDAHCPRRHRVVQRQLQDDYPEEMTFSPSSIYTSPHPMTPTGRAVSPDLPFSRSSSHATANIHNSVYVAASMRGKCFHTSSQCYGLRTASGTRRMSQEDAQNCGMGPCGYCKSEKKWSVASQVFPVTPPNRSVSPDPSLAYYCELTTNDANDNTSVYVAKSMRGNCYHAHDHCYGLRTASGVCQMSFRGALMRRMRACRVCNPLSPKPLSSPSLSPPSSQQQEPSFNKDNTDDDWQLFYPTEKLPSSSMPNRPTPKLRPTAPSTQQEVHIASSLKGKCYHSYPSCAGLRKASGTKVLSLQNAERMGMRPCKLCKLNCNHVASATAPHYLEQPKILTYGRNSTQRSTRVAHHATTVDEGGSWERKLPVTSTMSLTSPTGNYSKKTTQPCTFTSAVEHGKTKRHTYHTTSSGQCYHLSRSCSSLRRSKLVMQGNEKPMGKRACRLCC